MKAVVCAPRKFCWHLITKREGRKKISRSPRWSRRVILRERNLCDIDRIVHKRRRFACAHTNTHNFTNSLSSAFFGVCVGRALRRRRWWMSGCPLSLFYSTRLNGPFTDLSGIDGKTNPKNKTEALFFSALFSGSQPHGALSTPNILHSVKPLIKIWFSLPRVAGHSLRSMGVEVGLEGNQCNQSLLFPRTYSSTSFFFLIWQSFLMSGQTCDSF